MASTSRKSKIGLKESLEESDAWIDLFSELKMDLFRLEKLSPIKLHEDLLTMMKYNYPNERSFSTLSILGFGDLKYFCAHGIVYGAIQTTCLSCGGILCPACIDDDGYIYRCLNQGLLKSGCRNDIYYDVVFSSCWEIPINKKFQHPDIKQVMDKIMMNRLNVNPIHPCVRLLGSSCIGKVKGALCEFLKESCLHEREEYKIYVKNEGGVEKRYSYFLINRPDLSDEKYSFCQILVPRKSGKFTSRSDCLFYTRGKIYEAQKEGKQSMKIEGAIRWFEEKFLLNTGINWLSWCQLCSGKGANIHRNCFYDNKYMLPLKIDYQHKILIASDLDKGIPMLLAGLLQY